MTMLDHQHPVQTLQFFVDSQILPQHAEKMRAEIERLSALREKWVLGAPEFVDSAEVSMDDRHGDQPIRTVGGMLKIYTALPPWGDKLPKEIDRQHYEEVNLVVQHMRRLSGETGITIGFELDGTAVGWIQLGKLDRMLEVGLLGEWKKALGAS